MNKASGISFHSVQPAQIMHLQFRGNAYAQQFAPLDWRGEIRNSFAWWLIQKLMPKIQ
jgi:hypothetical protein